MTKANSCTDGNNPNQLLEDLVEALDGAFISSWQSTAAWRKQLDAAREYVNRMKEAEHVG